jgi:glycogen synthase kinase 3 beta
MVLITFSPQQIIELSIRPDLIPKLVPAYCEQELYSRGIDLNNFVPIPAEKLRLMSLD